MKNIMHLTTRGAPFRCVACAVDLEPLLKALPGRGVRHATCRNPRDFATIYPNDRFRRCIDQPEPIPPRRDFPTPVTEGWYWAEWRISDEGTSSRSDYAGVGAPLDVVQVLNLGSPDEPCWRVFVAGVDASQGLDCFVWRSGKIDEPRHEVEARKG